jgi:hypothetical protein
VAEDQLLLLLLYVLELPAQAIGQGPVGISASGHLENRLSSGTKFGLQGDGIDPVNNNGMLWSSVSHGQDVHAHNPAGQLSVVSCLFQCLLFWTCTYLAAACAKLFWSAQYVSEFVIMQQQLVMVGRMAVRRSAAGVCGAYQYTDMNSTVPLHAKGTSLSTCSWGRWVDSDRLLVEVWMRALLMECHVIRQFRLIFRCCKRSVEVI